MNGLELDLIDRAGAGFDIAWRATLLLAAAWLLTTLLRRHAAAIRHAVWAMALVGVMALPLAQTFLPNWRILPPLPESVTISDVASSSIPPPLVAQHRERVQSPGDDVAMHQSQADHSIHSAIRVSRAAATDTGGVGPENTPSPNHDGRLSAVSSWTSGRVVWRILWLAGVLAGSLPMVLGTARVWHLRRSSQRAPSSIQDEVRSLAVSLGLRRSVEVLLSADHEMPMTWGLFTPVLLLPASTTAWSPERRRMVLIHELAHIRRGDCLTHALAQFARALHWFNPLAWLALQRLRIEQERACDDIVLNSGADANEYASELLSITARLPRRTWDTTVALAMSRSHRIELRLRSILDSSCDRRPLSFRHVVATCGGVLIFTCAIAAAQRPGPQAAIPPSRTLALANEVTGDGKPAPQKAANPAQAAAQNQQPAPAQTAAAVDDLAKQALEKITRLSPTPVDSRSLNEAAIRGMLQSLNDPYSSMLTTEEMKEFTVHLDGKLVGVGAALRQEGDAIEVTAVMPDSPAIRGGLKPQDVILEIDGRPAPSLAEAVKQIRGQAGTKVTLSILRANHTDTLTLTRGEVRLPAVKGLSLDEQGQWRYWLDADQKIAFVQLTQFDHTTPEDLKRTLERLKEQGLRGVILDLRGNGGGLLASCVDVARLFLPAGTIVEIRGRSPPEHSKIEVPAGHAPLLAGTPLVVLIDSTTASAAEVLAAALQHHGRALLFGERTFGKGSVQSILPLGEGGPSLKLTTALMYTAAGRPLQRASGAKSWGVDPNEDCFVPLTPDQRAVRQKILVARETGQLKLAASVSAEFLERDAADPQLAAALKSLSAKLQTGEYAKTGRPLTELQTEVARQDGLRKQRDELRMKLDELDRQLGETR